jgi:hypothetical protein
VKKAGSTDSLQVGRLGGRAKKKGGEPFGPPP